MYQFDFIKSLEDSEQCVSVMATSYNEAVKKIRKLGLPGFDLNDYELEGVYEHGSIIPNSAN